MLGAIEAGGTKFVCAVGDEKGKINSGSNPNGSTRNIAGICNTNRTVFGMMPHPERATSEILGNTDGREILKNLLMSEVLV